MATGDMRLLSSMLVLLVVIEGCSIDDDYCCQSNDLCVKVKGKSSSCSPDMCGKCILVDPLQMTPQTISDAYLGQEDYSVELTASGGIPPYTWTLARGDEEKLQWLTISQQENNKAILHNAADIKNMPLSPAKTGEGIPLTINILDSSKHGIAVREDNQGKAFQVSMNIVECTGTSVVCYQNTTILPGICFIGTAPCISNKKGDCLLTADPAKSSSLDHCSDPCGPCNPDTESCCGGMCVNIINNPEHCGSCANTCKVTNASGSTCSNSTCLYKCDSNYGDCDNDWTNGCEEHLLTSATNCGACGATCKGDASYSPTCDNGICTCTSQDNCINTAIPWANGCIVSGLCTCLPYGNSSIPCPIGQYCCSSKGCCLSSCSDPVCSNDCESAGKVWCKSGCCDSCNPDTNC